MQIQFKYIRQGSRQGERTQQLSRPAVHSLTLILTQPPGLLSAVGLSEGWLGREGKVPAQIQ